MNFVIDIDKKDYEAFVKANKDKSHFLQSYAWGKFQEKANNRTAHYLGVKNNKGKLIAATLILEKKLPLAYSYFYSPRGFVMDFSDEKLLAFFTKNLKDYMKKKKAIFLKLDPDLIISKKNYQDEDLEVELDWKKILVNMKDLGYKHLGFTKNFETAQPRYSFRIDLTQGKEEVLNHFSKTTKKRIKKSLGFDIEIEMTGRKDLDKFFELMRATEARKGFINYDFDYYDKLFEIYSKDNEIRLFLAYLYPEKVIAKYQAKVDEFTKKKEALEANVKGYKEANYKEVVKQLNDSLENIKIYEKALKEHGKKILLNAHVIIFYGNKAWALYAGNKDILQDAGTNYELYQHHILYALEQGYEIYDNFGAVGDLSSNNPLAGLYIMKKSFGGDYVEFLGEFDLITNKLMYFIFIHSIGIYRKIMKRIRRLRSGNN